MERITSFKDSELDELMTSVYTHIHYGAKSAALMHVNTIDNNNPYHFEVVVKEANKAIVKLVGLYPTYNKKRDKFLLLDEQTLLKEASDFLNQDLY